MNITNYFYSKNCNELDCECNICYEQLNNDVIEVNCGNKHFYHRRCIEGYINSQMNRGIETIRCPNCREVITQYGCNKKIYNVKKYEDPYDIEYEEPSNNYERQNLNMYNMATGNRYIR